MKDLIYPTLFHLMISGCDVCSDVFLIPCYTTVWVISPDYESIVFALNHGEKTPERGMIRTETCPLRKQYFSPPQV